MAVGPIAQLPGELRQVRRRLPDIRAKMGRRTGGARRSTRHVWPPISLRLRWSKARFIRLKKFRELLDRDEAGWSSALA